MDATERLRGAMERERERLSVVAGDVVERLFSARAERALQTLLRRRRTNERPFMYPTTLEANSPLFYLSPLAPGGIARPESGRLVFDRCCDHRLEPANADDRQVAAILMLLHYAVLLAGGGVRVITAASVEKARQSDEAKVAMFEALALDLGVQLTEQQRRQLREDLAAAEPGPDALIVERDTANRGVRAFVVLLAIACERLFRKRAYSTVATIATAALGRCVSQSIVREACEKFLDPCG
jgi:hypothetical protein